MLLSAALCVFAASAPGASEVKTPDEVGHLRHAVLLEAKEGQHLVFATSSRLASRTSRVGIHRIALGDEVDPRLLGEPRDSVLFDFDLFESSEPLDGMSWTWHSEPPWTVVRAGERWRYVAHERRKERLHVVDSNAKETPLTVDGVDRLLDCRVDGARTRILVAGGGRVELLEIDERRTVRRRRALTRFEGPHVQACFPVDLDAGSATGDEAIVVSWRDRALSFHRVDLEDGASKSGSLSLRRVRPGVLRRAAWTDGRRRRVAVGLPGDSQGFQASSTSCRGIGRVVSLAFDGEGVRLLHETFPEGMSPEDLGVPGPDNRGITGYDFAETVTFVADRDEDTIPDLVVSAPSLFARYSLHVLSTETGRRLSTRSTGGFETFGASPSVDATGRLLLTMAPPPSYPELLHFGSTAYLLDLTSWRTLSHLATSAER